MEGRLQRLVGSPDTAETPQSRDARLLHELRVHQIELELQNEELRNARVETEAALERFSRLYSFAPVPYFTMDSLGLRKKRYYVRTRANATQRWWI